MLPYLLLMYMVVSARNELNISPTNFGPDGVDSIFTHFKKEEQTDEQEGTS